MYFFSPAVLSEAAFQPQNFLHFLAFGATLTQTLLLQHAFFFQLSRCILADKSYIVWIFISDSKQWLIEKNLTHTVK